MVARSIAEGLEDWVRGMGFTGGPVIPGAEDSDDLPRGVRKLIELEDMLFPDKADQRRSRRGARLRNDSVWREFIERATRVGHKRLERYRDYEAMADDESVIEPVLDLYVNEAFDRDLQRDRRSWTTVNEDALEKSDLDQEPEQIQKDLDHLWDQVLDVEGNIVDWASEVAEMGDLFIRPRFEEEHGIVFIEDDLHPADVTRISINGHLYGFFSPILRNTMMGATGADKNELFGPIDFVHFRIPGRQRRERLRNRRNMVRVEVEGEDEDFRITSKYGRAIIEAARRAYKEWRLLNNSLILGRVSGASRKLVIGVDTGQLPPHEAMDLLETYQELFGQDVSLDISGEDMQSTFDPGPYQERVLIPLGPNSSNLSTSEFGGNVDITGIADIKEARNRMFGALKVPPSLIGFEGDFQGSLNKSSDLKRLNIRFARQARRLQGAINTGLQQLGIIHLSSKYQIPVPPSVFSVHASWAGTAEHLEQANALKQQMGFVQNFANTLQSLSGRGGDGPDIDKEYAIEFLMRWADIPGFDVDRLLNKNGDEESVEEALEAVRQARSSGAPPRAELHLAKEAYEGRDYVDESEEIHKLKQRIGRGDEKWGSLSLIDGEGNGLHEKMEENGGDDDGDDDLYELTEDESNIRIVSSS